MAEAIALAQELNDDHSLPQAKWAAAVLAQYEHNPAEVKRYSSDLIELSTRQVINFQIVGPILSGWGRSASGDTADSMMWIEHGISNYRASGAVLAVPFYLALKAEVLHLADRTPRSP